MLPSLLIYTLCKSQALWSGSDHCRPRKHGLFWWFFLDGVSPSGLKCGWFPCKASPKWNSGIGGFYLGQWLGHRECGV